MKALLIAGLWFLTMCKGPTEHREPQFIRTIPDTVGSWVGKMTKSCFDRIRKLEEKLHLKSILNGSKELQLRVWDLGSSYDPQEVVILSFSDSQSARLRNISFYSFKNDSIASDELSTVSFNSNILEAIWNLKSQSDLVNGDSFGCMDGGEVFIEITNSEQYRCKWYRCPSINESKDSTFYQVSQLINRIKSLKNEG